MSTLAQPQHDPSRLAAAVLSVAMHVILLLVLIAGVSWQSHQPEAVVVELWQPPPEPVVQAPPPKPVPVPEIKPEPKPPPAVKKPDIVIEKEKKPPPKKEVPKKVEAPKKEPRLNLDLSRQIQEQAQRELENVEKDRERQQALAQFKTPPAAGRTLIDPGYGDKIRAKIKALIILPPDILGNPEAIFDVEQLPTGEVISARLRRSSGNRAYDQAVERAILKASPLPRPDRPDQFQRMLELRFRPREQ